MNSMPLQALQQRIAESELGKEWINDPLITKDVWPVKELGYVEEDTRMTGIRNLYFQNFSLPWLKLLTKLTVRASVREKSALSTILKRISSLKLLDKFLFSKGYHQPDLLTNNLLEQFITENNKNQHNRTIIYVKKLCQDEQWLNLNYFPRKYKKTIPKIEIIPEEVLEQIYHNLHLFPLLLERLFRLQLALGCRLGEMMMIPRKCLKQEEKKWFLLRWLEKRKQWKFYQIHPLVAELVREQQKCLDTHLGHQSKFDKLFCKVSTASWEGAKGGGTRFENKPIYMAQMMSKAWITQWLRDFSKKADLKDKHGHQFSLQSHQFRRTKASIMAHCETEDEYIAAVLGHSSLDMLPHYRQRSLEKLEREADSKGYVDMYGQITTFKPKKRKYEKLAELLKVSTPLGECHRPTMLGDCQSRYACLSCNYHRVSFEDRENLEIDIQALKQNLQQAKITKAAKRITEINQLLNLLNNRLEGLKKLKKIKEDFLDV